MKRNILAMIVSIILVMSFGTQPAFAANTLVNGSFEDQNYTGWTLSEYTLPLEPSYPGDGTFGIAMDGQTIGGGNTTYDFYLGMNVTQESDNLPITYNATDGSYLAYMLSNDALTFRMYQDITLDASAENLTWDMMYANDWDSFDPMQQYLEVDIRAANDTILQTLFKTTEGDPLSINMTSFSVDISTYAGQTIRLDVEESEYQNYFDSAFDNFAIAGGNNTVVNGSFEAQDYTGWTLMEYRQHFVSPQDGTFGIAANNQTINSGNSTYDFCDGVNVTQWSYNLPITYDATDGGYLAYILTNNYLTFRMYQDITLDGSAENLTWDMMYANDASYFDPTGQYLEVNIRSTNDTILQTLFKTTDGVDPYSINMTGFSANISAYAGQTIRLDIEEREYESSLDSAFDNFVIGGGNNTLVNGSFEDQNYTGWTLMEYYETLYYPDNGTFGIATNGQTINYGEATYDFNDGVNVTQTSPGLPITYTATDGDYLAYMLVNGPETLRMYQDVTLDASAKNLTWDMMYNNHNDYFDPVFQYLAVDIRDTNDHILKTLFKTKEGDPVSINMTSFSADISAYAGQTIRIDVEQSQYDYWFDSAFDNFAISSEAGPAHSNDNFADATVITGTSGNTTGTNVEATIEDGEPQPFLDTYTTDTVWWSWTAPATGTAAFDTLGSNFDTVMAAYTGDNVSSLTKLSENDDFIDGSGLSRIVFEVTENTTYHIQVAGYGDDTGDITLNWGYAIPPANDDFPGETISGTSGSSVFSSDNATREAGEPNPGYDGFSSLWWSWTAPLTGNVTFDTNGSLCDNSIEAPWTVLAIYTGTSVGNLTPIDYDDSSPYNEVALSAVEGTTYRITIDGGDTYPDSKGSIHLNWRYPAVPIFTSANSTAFVVGAPGLFDIITEADPTASSISIISGTLPTGVNFTNYGVGTADLSGTPAAGTGGTYPLIFSANNTFFTTAQNFTLTVNEAPAFVSANSTTFSTGSTNSFTVNATGYPTPSVSLTSGIPPSGVAYNSSTGVLSGTPTEGGTFALTFTASNGVSPNATQNFTLNVVGNAAPSITAQPQSTAVAVGDPAPFEVAYTADPSPSIQWQISTNGGRKWKDIAGATSDSYNITATTNQMDGNIYRVVLDNGIGGPVTSEAATLTVVDAPSLVTANVSVTQNATYNGSNRTITWTITVSNSGPDTAQGIEVQDSLATGTRFDSITSDNITEITSSTKVHGRNIIVSVGELNSGESVHFDIVSSLDRRTTLPVDNSVTVTTTSYDPDTSNNSFTYTLSS